MKKKQQKLLIIIAVILIVLLIIVFGIKKEESVEEFMPEEIQSMDLKNMPTALEVDIKEIDEPVEVVSGGSLVDNKGAVVTDEGSPTQASDIIPNSPQAPQQSEALTLEEVPESGIQISLSSETGFNPRQFKVKPGQVVTIVLTAIDNQEHTFRFKDSSLRAVAISVGGGETRAITFNAPNSMGVYDFMCGKPDHRDKEKGQMIVVEE